MPFSPSSLTPSGESLPVAAAAPFVRAAMARTAAAAARARNAEMPIEIAPARGPMPHAAFLQPGAGDGARTRDPELGKLVLYRLSYTRMAAGRAANIPV